MDSGGPPIVTGFHGTTRDAMTSIFTEGFRRSGNEYDWLGDGVYFFQDNQERAWTWARQQHASQAAVIRASIDLDSCIDLVGENRWWDVIERGYEGVVENYRQLNRPLPPQSSGAHRLDRLVINYVVDALAQAGTVIKSVRAAFAEGGPAFPNSALYDKTHIQIAVRDITAISSVVQLEV